MRFLFFTFFFLESFFHLRLNSVVLTRLIHLFENDT